MTTGHEDHYGGKKGKTMDDIYYVIRSIESKIEDILDEVSEVDFKARGRYNSFSLKDLYDNEDHCS